MTWRGGLVLVVLVGCHPLLRASPASSVAPPAPRVIAGGLDGAAMLAEPAARATEAGAGPLSVVATGEAAERERLGAFVEVPEGVCLLGYARASRSIEDLNLAAFSDEGTPVAVDDAPDPHPTLLLCPPHPGRVYLAAVAASGEGLVAVGAQLVPLTRAPVVGRAMNAHGTRTASSRAAEAWPGLDDHIRKHHDALGGNWEVFRKVAVAVDARMPAEVAFPLEPDSCCDAVITPDDDVGGLDVEALDDRGHLIARGAGDGRDRTLTVCSPTGWGGTLSIRPHVGQGLVAVALSRAKSDEGKGLAVEPDLAWAAATEPIDRARARRDKELRDAGYGAPVGAKQGALGVGTLRTFTLDVGAEAGGRCLRFDVIGGAPVALLAATAWDATGHLLSHAEGAASATVFTCAATQLRIDTEARARPGPYAVTWRSEPWSDASFASHPIAAARMLTRMAEGGPSLLPGSAVGARALHVDAGQESLWTQVVPAGSCARFVAAAQGSGAGIVGRVVDAVSGDELDRAHARDSIALRACALDGAARPVSVSITATAGSLDVVVGERVTR